MNIIDLATIPVVIADKIRRTLYFLLNISSQKSRLEKIREKKVIDVAFLLYNLPKWKTEGLYLKMAGHPRFNPVIVCTLPLIQHNISAQSAIKEYSSLIEYLRNKDYNFCEATNWGDFKADIVFFQEPYVNLFQQGFDIIFSKKIFGYIPYGFYIDTTTKSRHSWLTRNCIFLFEHNSLICNLLNRGGGKMASKL